MKLKNVIGYEGVYAVSEVGNVYNLKRGTTLGQTMRNGYQYVCLTKDKRRRSKSVHKVVFESFKGRVIENLVIDHIDGNKLNNHIDNLRQITTRENTSKGWKEIALLPTGVSYVKHLKKYKAEIQIENIRYYLGVHETVELAEDAYKEALDNWEVKGEKPFKRDRTKKHCKGCDTTKSVKEFYHVKGHGYTYLCKECHKKEVNKNRSNTDLI